MTPGGRVSNLGRAGNGRPKGSKNKLGVAAKDVIAACAEGLGGSKRMLEWAKSSPENERMFWVHIYTKLIPLRVANEDGESLKIIIQKP